MSQVRARFIIGTGRCGSTILSKMIDLHPDVAVLSEFLVSLDFVKKFGERQLGGDELAEIIDCGLAAGSGVFKKIVAHLATPEVVFEGGATKLPADAGRYRDNVFPEVILIPLAHLFDEPAEAFDELLQFVRQQPVRALSQHYYLLFDWLTRKAGKTIWVERSGGTIANLPELIELFPDARFLHLHRNPLDVALSMQHHNHFRLRAFKHFDLQTADGIRWSDLDNSDLNNNLPTSPRLKSILAHPVPLDYFLEDISESILRGMKEIKNLTPEQYREISFEALMSDPKGSLCTIADFFELPCDDTWLENGSALLKPGQAGHATPDTAQAELLRQHCHAIMVLLGHAPTLELHT